VERVLVRLGDSVKVGQVLVSLSGREQAQAALSAAEQEELQARLAFDLFNEGGAAVSSAQAGIDVVAARKVLKDVEERLANLKYQRWLFEVRTKNQIGAMENQLNEKFSNPTDEDLADAEYQVVLAKARLNAASLKSSGMKDGTDPDQQALLQAALKTATAQVAAARAALERLDLKAPFAGEVSLLSVSPGDTAGPGQVLVIVTDSSALLVETTDLSERDVVGLEVGREVSVRVKPLGKTVDGMIIAISSRAESIGGDVVYRTVIELKEIPAGARAGMTVEVGL
jgi:multidrug resistance efflux pump